MGAHVAAGLPWFDRPVTKGVVVYVAAERGALVKRRLAAWRQRHGERDIPLIVIEGVFDFCAGKTHAVEILRIAQEASATYALPVVWFIIDTKAQVMAGADSNSDKDTMAMVGNAALLQHDTGAHVTIIDHVPHYAPDRLKGSGALAGAVDGSFLVTKVARGHHRVTIGSKQPNDGPDELDIAFGLESEVLSVAENGKATKAPVVVKSEQAPPPKAKASTKPRLKPAGQKVYSAFGRLFDTGKTFPAPSAPGVRPGTRAVTLAELKEMAFTLSIYPEAEPPEPGKDRDRWRNSRNTAWRRGLDDVQASGMLRVESGFAWDPWREPQVTGHDSPNDQW